MARDSPKGAPTRAEFPGLQVCALPPAWGPLPSPWRRVVPKQSSRDLCPEGPFWALP